MSAGFKTQKAKNGTFLLNTLIMKLRRNLLVKLIIYQMT